MQKEKIEAGAEIFKRRLALEKDLREYRQRVMSEYNATHYKKLRELQEECRLKTGHKWEWDEINPVGTAFFHCHYCSETRSEVS